jgi:hypothetical protein
MSGHRPTLEAIFTTPVPGGIKWPEIEAPFKHLGCEITEGRGSRMRVSLNGQDAVHRPHPPPDTDKGAVKVVRRFLKSVGVEP